MALTDNIIAAYPLTANANDASGNGYNGTATSVTFSASGGAFNGSSSKIVITDAAGLKPTGNFSIMFTITGSGTDRGIFQTFSQNTLVAGIGPKIGGSNKVEFVSGTNTNNTPGSGFQFATGATTANDSVTRTFFCVYDGSSLTIYRNGNNSDGTVSWSNPAGYAATNYVRIGCRNTSGTDIEFFNGTIYNVNFWSRALSGAEMDALYNAGTPLVYPFSSFQASPMMHMMAQSGGLM